jgi:hypothetical protein
MTMKRLGMTCMQLEVIYDLHSTSFVCRILKNINLQNLKRASAFIDIGKIQSILYIDNTKNSSMGLFM